MHGPASQKNLDQTHWLSVSGIDCSTLDPTSKVAFGHLCARGIVRLSETLPPVIQLRLPDALMQCSSCTDLPPPRRHLARDLHTLMRAIFNEYEFGCTTPVEPAALSQSMLSNVHTSPQALYDELHAYSTGHSRPAVGISSLAALKPQLKPYQLAAVEWMCAREHLNGVTPQIPIGSECMWKQLRCADGELLHWNFCNGALLVEQGSGSVPIPSDARGPTDGRNERCGNEQVREKETRLSGGILADEMGLGKTVEVVALMLAHHKPPAAARESDQASSSDGDVENSLPCVCRAHPHDFDGCWVGCDVCGRWVHRCCSGLDSVAEAEEVKAYMCLHCATLSAPRETGATLLLCPGAILAQWRDEVARHVREDALRVVVYPGLKHALGAAAKHPEELGRVHPAYLSQADLVLSSLETLRHELDYSASVSGTQPKQTREMRRGGGSAAAALSSPLLALRWWRLVVDEAQMVESGTAKAAAMAAQLHAQHSLNDLQGLMRFLKLEPWDEHAVWHHAIELPLTAPERSAQLTRAVVLGSQQAKERLLQLLDAVMWRNSKAAVIDQLELPPQTTRTHMLAFSSIERHFYSKQHHACAKAASAALSMMDRTSFPPSTAAANQLSKTSNSPSAGMSRRVSLDANRALEKLTPQILRLRQACCHPQLGSFGVKRAGPHPALMEPMTMSDILTRLLEDERTRCEEALRKVILNTSALGAMRSMVGRHADACVHYLDVLVLVDELRVPVPPKGLGLHVVVHGPRAFTDGTAASECESGTAEAEALRDEQDADERDKVGSRKAIKGPRTYEASQRLGPFEWRMNVPVLGTRNGEAPVDLWVRFELSNPIRLSQLVIQLSPVRQKGVLIPCRCSLSASSGGEGSGVFVEIASFKLNHPTASAAASGESAEVAEQLIDMYRTTRAKQYRLHISTVYMPTALDPVAPECEAGVVSDGEPIVQITQLALREAEIEVDSLQLLHVTHNLAESVRIQSEAAKAVQPSECAACDEKTGEGGEVKVSADIIRSTKQGTEEQPEPRKYFSSDVNVEKMLSVAENVRTQLVCERSASASAARNHLRDLIQQIEQLRQRRRAVSGSTRTPFLRALYLELEARPSVAQQLQQRLLAEPLVKGDAAREVAVSTLNAVLWCEHTQRESEAARQQLIDALEQLPSHPSDAEVYESGNCGKCRLDWFKTGPICRLCRLEAIHTHREGFLFSYRRQRKVSDAVLQIKPNNKEDAGAAASNMGEAFMEESACVTVLRALARWASSTAHDSIASANHRLQQLATLELEELALMKRELRACRQMWIAQFDLLSQLDELRASTITMVLTDKREEQEELPEVEQHTLVGTWEYEDRWSVYQLDLADARTELRNARTQLAYLRGVSTGERGASNECPVCFNVMASERVVASCAHSVCMRCADEMMKRRAGKFVCPLCQKAGTPSHASVLQWSDGSSAGTSVKGSWSTKLTAVVEETMRLPEGDKCLIFSMWEEMLGLIERALSANDIAFCRVKSQATLDSTLLVFRQRPDIRALLLPLSRGANGLNLVEAQHVFLVEPLLNPAVEAQAISRVHRLSQQRSTTVHHFIVEDTVEEAIYRLRECHSKDAGANDASPAKKQKRAVEEAKSLTWDQLRYLFCSESSESGAVDIEMDDADVNNQSTV